VRDAKSKTLISEVKKMDVKKIER